MMMFGPSKKIEIKAGSDEFVRRLKIGEIGHIETKMDTYKKHQAKKLEFKQFVPKRGKRK